MSSQDESLQSLQYIHDFFMQAPIPMAVALGPEHFFVHANPAYEKLIGRRATGKVSEVFSPEEVDRFIPLLDEVYKTGVPFEGKEMNFTLKNELGEMSEYFLNFTYSPLRGHDGSIKGVFATVENVTESVNKRKEVTESLSKFRTIADAMPQMVWSTRPDGFHDYYNQQWYDYTGVPAGSTDGEAWSGMFHPEDLPRAWKIWSHCLKTGEPYEIEYRLRHRSGNYRWTLGRALPIRNEKGGIIRWMGTCTDIQELRTTTDRLSKSISDLVEEEELRKKFIATLAHDLRTPLTAAKMKAQLIAIQSKDNEALKSEAELVVDNINRTDRMIRNLLDANRLRAGEKLPVFRVSGDLALIVQKSISELSALHGVNITYRGEASEKGKWDAEAFRRVIENLVDNAMRYGDKNRPIKVSLDSSGDSIMLSVHNEGNPISPEDQKHLFDPYKRTVSSNVNKEGWGLGLALVKGVAEAFDGSVSVESGVSGTRFTLTLPKEEN